MTRRDALEMQGLAPTYNWNHPNANREEVNPMAGNSGGPWGGGSSGGGSGNNGNGGGRGGPGGPRRGGDGENPQIPEIDEIVRKGQEQLRVLMGGRGGSGSGGDGGGGFRLTRGTVFLGLGAAVILWGLASFYTVKPEEQSVELLFGQYYSTGNPGLNFAPWPVVTAEVCP